MYLRRKYYRLFGSISVPIDLGTLQVKRAWIVVAWSLAAGSPNRGSTNVSTRGYGIRIPQFANWCNNVRFVHELAAASMVHFEPKEALGEK